MRSGGTIRRTECSEWKLCHKGHAIEGFFLSLFFSLPTSLQLFLCFLWGKQLKYHMLPTVLYCLATDQTTMGLREHSQKPCVKIMLSCKLMSPVFGHHDKKTTKRIYKLILYGNAAAPFSNCNWQWQQWSPFCTWLISNGLNMGCFRGTFVKVLNMKFSHELQSSYDLLCFSIIESVGVWNLGGLNLSFLTCLCGQEPDGAMFLKFRLPLYKVERVITAFFL